MARLPRPYIPLAVRVRVIERMARAYGVTLDQSYSLGTRLKRGLALLFLDANVQLDHDPALENRRQILNRSGKFIRYEPDANDPEYLIYREKHAHHIKTNVRGDGAQYPDRVLAKRERRRLRKDRPVRKIPSRPFPKRPAK